LTRGSSSASGSHVRLLERLKQEAFFAERQLPKRFLADRRELLDDV